MRILIPLAAIAACALTAPAALAQHAYLAAQWGRIGLDDFGVVDEGITGDSANLNDHNVFGLTGGYNFSEHWGMEVGYRDLGSYGPYLRVNGGDFIPDIEVTGWVVGAVGNLPVSPRFTLYGKLGMLAYDADLSGTVRRFNSFGPDGRISASDDGNELYYAVGGKVRLGKGTVDLGLDYTIYNDIADAINLALTINIARPRPASQP